MRIKFTARSNEFEVIVFGAHRHSIMTKLKILLGHNTVIFDKEEVVED